MVIDLGIAWFECSNCGALIYPPPTISSKGVRKHVRAIELPPPPEKVPEEALMPKWLYDDIQAGKHDANPRLARFRGRKYDECIAVLRAEYGDWRDQFIAGRRVEADKLEGELRKKATSVSRRETEDSIVIEAEGFEAVIEGNEMEGRVRCPRCGSVLCEWRK